MQFSLRSLFVWIGFIAVYCGVVFALPTEISVALLSIVTVLGVPVVIGGIIYTRGPWRAFWIGCSIGFSPFLIYAFPVIAMSFYPIFTNGEVEEHLNYLLGGWHLFVVVNGIIVVMVRWSSIRGCEPKGESSTTSSKVVAELDDQEQVNNDLAPGSISAPG